MFNMKAAIGSATKVRRALRASERAAKLSMARNANLHLVLMEAERKAGVAITFFPQAYGACSAAQFASTENHQHLAQLHEALDGTAKRLRIPPRMYGDVGDKDVPGTPQGRHLALADTKKYGSMTNA